MSTQARSTALGTLIKRSHELTQLSLIYFNLSPLFPESHGTETASLKREADLNNSLIDSLLNRAAPVHTADVNRTRTAAMDTVRQRLQQRNETCSSVLEQYKSDGPVPTVLSVEGSDAGMDPHRLLERLKEMEVQGTALLGRLSHYRESLVGVHRDPETIQGLTNLSFERIRIVRHNVMALHSLDPSDDRNLLLGVCILLRRQLADNILTAEALCETLHSNLPDDHPARRVADQAPSSLGPSMSTATHDRVSAWTEGVRYSEQGTDSPPDYEAMA